MKRLCDESDEDKLTEDMRRIRLCEGTDEAHAWVIQFRKDLFTDLPIVWINDEVDQVNAWGATLALRGGDRWTGSLRLDTSVLISSYIVRATCAAAEANDIGQFQNHLFIIQTILSHEIGGHLVRLRLLGSRGRREKTPPTIGTDLGWISEITKSKGEAGFYFTQLLFGGLPFELTSFINLVSRYQKVTPTLFVRDPEDPEFVYLKEILITSITAIVGQGEPFSQALRTVYVR